MLLSVFCSWVHLPTLCAPCSGPSHLGRSHSSHTQTSLGSGSGLLPGCQGSSSGGSLPRSGVSSAPPTPSPAALSLMSFGALTGLDSSVFFVRQHLSCVSQPWGPMCHYIPAHSTHGLLLPGSSSRDRAPAAPGGWVKELGFPPWPLQSAPHAPGLPGTPAYAVRAGMASSTEGELCTDPRQRHREPDSQASVKKLEMTIELMRTD